MVLIIPLEALNIKVIFLSADSELSDVIRKKPDEAKAQPLGSTLTTFPVDTVYDTSVPSVLLHQTHEELSVAKSNVTLEPDIAAGNIIPVNNIPSVFTPKELFASLEISIKAFLAIDYLNS